MNSSRKAGSEVHTLCGVGTASRGLCRPSIQYMPTTGPVNIPRGVQGLYRPYLAANSNTPLRYCVESRLPRGRVTGIRRRLWCVCNAASTEPCISGSAWKMSVYTSHFTASLASFRHQPGSVPEGFLRKIVPGRWSATCRPRVGPPLHDHSSVECCSAPGTT